MHCGNTTFAYSNEFNDYMKVEGALSENIFDVAAENFLLEKGKKYLLELFEKQDPEHLKQIDEDFDDYSNNDGLKDINGDEKGMQNLNNDDQSYHH